MVSLINLMAKNCPGGGRYLRGRTTKVGFDEGWNEIGWTTAEGKAEEKNCRWVWVYQEVDIEGDVNP